MSGNLRGFLVALFIFIFSNFLSAFPEVQPDFQGLPVVSMDIEGQKVWFKRSGPEKIGLKGCLKKSLASMIPISTLRPTYYCSQHESFDNELRRIKLLSEKRIRVPTVLKQTNDWIALSDLGPTFDSLIRKAQSDDEKIVLIQKATLGLAELHSKNQYHGRGVLRDMILTREGEVGFIDFEENPEGPLLFKQARDLLMYLYSIVEYSDDPKFMKAALTTYQGYGPKTPYFIAIRFLQLISPLIRLLKFAPLGRDGLRFLKAQDLVQKALD